MNRVRVKICGVTRREDALYAAGAGADAIGFVLYAESPRRVEPEAAAAIARALPPFVSRVGLFVDAAPELVRSLLAVVPLDLLQFHGSEPPELCRSFGRSYLKAVRMQPGVDFAGYEQRYADAAGLLLDASVAGKAGGTGRTFDWALVPRKRRLPVVLAGGLTPENVAGAIDSVRPWAVDVSGGVESAHGIKDHARIAALVAAVTRAGTGSG